MTRWYALCEGVGLRQCGSCLRNVENQPESVRADPHQPHFRPAVYEDAGACGDWMGKLERTHAPR